MNTNKLFALLTAVCEDCAHYPDGTSRDYGLQEIADAMAGTVNGDSITVHGYTIQMDGSTWVEMGHQYSLLKQWWPIAL